MPGTQSQLGFGGASSVIALHSNFAWNSTVALGRYWPSVNLLSGACTAGAWKTILSITGSRVRINALLMTFADATARTGRVRITIDDVEVFDATATNSGGTAHVAIGQVVASTTASLLFQPVDCSRSVLVEYQGSLTETDKASFQLNYEVRR